MSTQPYQPCIPLSRPVAARFGDRVVAVLGAAWRLPRAAWRHWESMRELEHRYDAVMNLPPQVLRDIGAPDWVVSASQGRLDVEAQRLDELGMTSRELPSRW